MDVRTLIPWGRERTPAPLGDVGSPLWALHREMNRLFDEFWRDFDLPAAVPARLGRGLGWPTIEMAETDKEVKVTAELPGLTDQDVEVLLHDNVLTLRGEKKSETEDKERHFSERVYGRFERRIPLEAEVQEDHVQAEFRNGVLTVTLPKSAQVAEKAKRIPVTAH